jgi:N-acetylglucosamine kinase-like BadF-type ATPase
MPKYYIAADGGGSKLQAILYDENFHILRTGRVAGVNTLFKPAETVRANVDGMIQALLQGGEGDTPVTEIAAADLCLVGAGDIVRDALNRFARVEQIFFHSEPVVGLAAALKTSGVVTLSGTGSDAFFVRDGVVVSAVGGWGPLLGDEGSGYEIGLNALKAAIYSYDGRRPKSVLYDMVMETWNLSNLWGIVGHLAGNPDARHEVASAAVLCAKAANAGDRVALRIYEHAALELSIQTRSVIDPNREGWDGTAVIMGGAWKGCPRMFEVFRHEIELIYPESHVEKPLFEPVVGCAVLRARRDGVSEAEIREGLARGFGEFLYP